MVPGTAYFARQQSAEGAADPSPTAVTKAGLLTSKYTGVCWNKKNKRWQASINSGGKYLYLGSFQHEDEAARMFDLAAIKLRGTKAKTNFPLETYMDHTGKLVENEALNATIAVHEQLVLAQKLATAQALALAGVTKKPRASAGGTAATAAAATAAKRLARANATNPITSSEDVSTQSAAVHGNDSGSAAAVATGLGLGQQLFGDDLALLQQAATTAATHAALATPGNMQHQQLHSAQHRQMRHQPQRQHHNSWQQRGLDDVQSSARQQPHQEQQQQEEQHEHQMHAQAVQLGDVLQQPAGLMWQQQSPTAMHQVAAASVPLQQLGPDTLIPGVPLDGQELQQQKEQEPQLEQRPNLAPASRTQQDANTGLAVTAGLEPQLKSRVGVVPPPPTGWDTPSWQQHVAVQDVVLPAADAATAKTVLRQRKEDPAAGLADEPRPTAAPEVMQSSHATSAAPVIRLSDLSSHVPAGGQLLALVPGEGGLCGVVYSQPTPQDRTGWGTALWDGCVWHPGGTFGSEGSAASACQFAVTFAKQLAVSANTVAATDQQQQEHPRLQTQQAARNQQIPPLSNVAGNMGSRSAVASHCWQLTDPAKISSTSNKRSRNTFCAQQGVATTGNDPSQQANLDQLATAAGALMEQQLGELQCQQPMQQPALQQQQQQQQPQECARQQTPSSGFVNEQTSGSSLRAQQGLHLPEHLTDASASGGPHRAAPGRPAAVPSQATLPADVAASITLEMLVDLGLLPRSSAARLDPELHPEQQQHQQPELSKSCHQEPQQQHHRNSAPDPLVGNPASLALDSSSPLRTSQTSGISSLLVQLLQRVTSGDDMIASQQGLDLLGSLRCLMNSGSNSYESLLFSILGGSSGLEPSKYDSIPAMTSPVHTTCRDSCSHQHLVSTPLAAAVRSPTAAADDYGVFGGKGGMEAALLAAATTSSATAIALGSSSGAYHSGVVALSSPSQISQCFSTTPAATPRPSNTASALEQTPSLSMHPVRMTPLQDASGSMTTQHGSELLAPSMAQSGTGYGNKQWASTLGAYLLSTKEVEQQHRESQCEQNQLRKRRCTLLQDKVEASATPMEIQQQPVDEDRVIAEHAKKCVV